MRRPLHSSPLVLALARAAAASPGDLNPQRSYYDPGRAPRPVRPRATGSSPSAAPTRPMTRQERRQIVRELTHPRFARALAEARRHPEWATPSDEGIASDPARQGQWRHLWLALLEHDARASAETASGGATC